MTTFCFGSILLISPLFGSFGLDPDTDSNPDAKLTAGRLRNKSFGSATLQKPKKLSTLPLVLLVRVVITARSNKAALISLTRYFNTRVQRADRTNLT